MAKIGGETGGASSSETERPSRRSLAEALMRQTGCGALEGDAVSVRFRRARYLLTPLATCETRPIVLVERIGPASIPHWHARRQLHEEAARLHPHSVILCTDAAATHEVWGWRRVRAMLPIIYVEEHRPGAAEGTRPLPWPTGVECGAVEESAAVQAGIGEGASALLSRLRTSGTIAALLRKRAGETPVEMLVRVIEESRTPLVAREVWRGIVGLRVLDPACGDGGWLLGCLESLVTVGLACLERMQGWIAADDASPRGRRAEAYPDFRRLLRRRRELAVSGGRERFAFETVLLRCLHGVAESPFQEKEAHRKLAGRVPRSGADRDHLLGEALIDVRIGSLGEAPELETRMQSSRGPDGRSGAVACTLAARAGALERAEAQLVRLRLELGGSLEDLMEGRREVARRRSQVRIEQPGVRPGRHGATHLHPLLEYPGVVHAGGFDLVRGDLTTVEGRKEPRRAC